MEGNPSERIHKGAEGFVEFAELEIQRSSQLHQSLMEQHGSLYRWILASRLAVNGGAAIALLDNNFVPTSARLVSLFCFFLGVVFAIVGAEFDQKSIDKHVGTNLEVLKFWVHAKATGLFNDSKADQLIDETKMIHSTAKPGKYIGHLSLVMFVIGAVVLSDVSQFVTKLVYFFCGPSST